MSDTQIKEASRLLLQRLREGMRKCDLPTLPALAAFIDVPENTLRHWFREGEHSLPNARTLQKIREKLPVISDDDARVIETAYSRRVSISRAGPKKGRRSRERERASEIMFSQSPSSDRDATIGRLVRQLFREVIPNGHGEKPATIDAVTFFSSQAAGRYDIGDMPAVLTKENFETVDVSQWTEHERQQFLGYANLALEEARKCLLLLAQFTPENDREELLKRLGRNADLLWRTYRAASSVAPMEFVRDIELAGMCGNIVSNS